MGWRWSLITGERRQSLQIGGNRLPVLRGHLAGGKLYHLHHGTADVVKFWGKARFQEVGDIPFAPVANAIRVGRDIGHAATIGAGGRTSKPPIRIQGPEAVAGRVALAAVAQHLDEIGAARLLLVQGRVRREAPLFEVHPAPGLQEQAEAEGKLQLVLPVGGLDRFDALQVGPKRRNVLVAHPRIGGVGEGWVIGFPRRRASFTQSPRKVFLAPVPQTRLAIRRDVRAVEGSEGGGYGPAACEKHAVIRSRVATLAGCRDKDRPPALKLRVGYLLGFLRAGGEGAAGERARQP